MSEIGIRPDHFNPRILYVLKRRFDSHANVVYHSHDFISLVYVLSGGCTYNINNELYEVKKGAFL